MPRTLDSRFFLGPAPFQVQMLGPERLGEMARKLAAEHALPGALDDRRSRRSWLTRRPRPWRGQPLLERLRENQQALRAARAALTAPTAGTHSASITPAAEWLTDNFFLVEEQVREARHALPQGYYRELPKLRRGAQEGLPRVYAVALAFVEHTDSRFDAALLTGFVRAYEEGSALTLGELWAIPISLRLVLVENLRRLAEGVVRRGEERRAADALADQLLGLGEPPPQQRLVAPRALVQRLGSDAFTVQLIQRLREEEPPSEDPASPLAADGWLHRALAERGLDADELVRGEHQRQAARQVTIANVISSMRQLSAYEWRNFVEAVSRVEEILRGDPAGVHARQDFATRDAMRHAVEALARGARRQEAEVAELAIHSARGAVGRASHVGYHLIGPGREARARDLGFRRSAAEALVAAVRAAGLWYYLGFSAVLVGSGLAVLALGAASAGASAPVIALLAALAALPLSEAAAAIVQRFTAALVPPERLPKIDVDAVPADLATLVAVPALLTSREEIGELVERLEVHYLANSEGHLTFALLADLADSTVEHAEGDADLIAAAEDGVAGLNLRHGPAEDGSPRFLLLRRRRLWNERQGCWMGWERKRGKIHELNRLLRGARDTSYVSPAAPGQHVRFVITLDADTRLPLGAARRLVGALAHPLNRPEIDPGSGRVVAGYGILQPRVVPMLPAGGVGSLFQTIYAGPTGIDPYVGAVSDVYQDLFGEGSYTGKGIYELDAFETSLSGRVPENSLLSHDLFEGSFARAGLAADIVLFEEFPTHAQVNASRQHRWVRGDWQLLPWILGRRRGASLTALGRWKMLDNLRRSLVAPASAVLLALGWAATAMDPLAWLLAIAALLAVPPVVSVAVSWMPHRRGAARRTHYGALLREATISAAQGALNFVFLATRAAARGDAVLRTLWRLWFTRRRLLEWTTAAQAGLVAARSPLDFQRQGLPALVLAAGLLGVAVAARPESWPAAAVAAALWLQAPAIAWWLSLPRRERPEEPLAAAELAWMRALARQTWSYFEDLAGEEQRWLPADNLQEDPGRVVARRTSPTNIGLHLSATVAAAEMGWLGRRDAALRLRRALDAAGQLERFRGHWLNWYDTETDRPLLPRYVSSVDSGNFAGHLVAVASACESWRLSALAAADPAGPAERALEGFADALWLARREAGHELDSLAASLAAVHPETEKVAPSLARLGAEARRLADGLEGEAPEASRWLRAAAASADSAERDVGMSAAEREAEAQGLAALARQANEFAAGMDFALLFDRERKLFAVGYQVEEARFDPAYFDLLASEARLTSFLAVGRGDAPPTHWYRLGRPLAPMGRGSVLLSWSGSMFEYLMAPLLLDEPAGGLLDQTCLIAVRQQMRYGAKRRVPWGISESAYNARDRQLNYQYGPFGVPELGLRREEVDELVVAPYATALAAMLVPHSALENFARLERLGARGRHGFYDALDFTAARLPEGERFVLVRCFMAHHQAMSVLAIAHLATGGALRRYFHAHPLVRSAELLLQERTPRDVMAVRPAPSHRARPRVRSTPPASVRRFDSPDSPLPRTHLLSNGRWTTLVTQAGAGFCRASGVAVTRFREDPTCEDWGPFLYLRDERSGEVWSAGFQPTARRPDAYEVIFSEAKAEIRRRDGAVGSFLEIVVTPEDDAELRRLTLTNHGSRARRIEVTTYAEVVLAPQAADEAHPAFSNLFVETFLARGSGALLARRRPRSAEEPERWAAHVLAVAGEGGDGGLQALQFETDRLRFLGRGRRPRDAASVFAGRPLSGTVGHVLDPVFSLRRTVHLEPRSTARLLTTTLVAASRDEAEALAEKYAAPGIFQRAATLAWTAAEVELRHLGMTHDEAHLYQRLASRLLFADPALRSQAAARRNRLGQKDLWGYGVSGDLPMVLVRVESEEDRDLARQLVRAHHYWRLRGLAVDVVLLNEHTSGYALGFQRSLEALARSSAAAGEPAGGAGGVHVLRADTMPPEHRDVLRAAARAVLVARHGSLGDQLARREIGLAPSPRAGPRPGSPAAGEDEPRPALAALPASGDLEFWNGIGGLGGDGTEYVIRLEAGRTTPQPWINVVADADFGFQVSETGSGFTWAGNSREHRLTPWSNDPVSDPPGELLVLRDEETGDLFAATAAPFGARAGEPSSYVCRHGRGVSRFEHAERGVGLELAQFVPVAAGPAAEGRADPVKVSHLTVRNLTDRPRRLTVVAYVEWVLGSSRAASAPFVVTARDEASGALLARNDWQAEFSSGVAFAWLGAGRADGASAYTCDRAEFLGRNGSLDRPAALAGSGGPSGSSGPYGLSGRTGAALDPCAAIVRQLHLAPRQSAEVVFLLGWADGGDTESRERVRELVERYRRADLGALLRDVERRWEDVGGALQVRTPDRALDVMVNHWLLRQTLACRFWARSAFYQSSGAFGFRDQLQDAMAATVPLRHEVRAHLLRAAARQFEEGDVQHWWHMPSGRGVRTRCSDDLLWLPLAAAHYVEVTGDHGVLDEEVPFLTQPPLAPGQEDDYRTPEVSAVRASLYEHCARAVDYALPRRGEHGLPLMGSGDWNDGMNRVGIAGRGESVWLGWFLCAVLERMAALAAGRGGGEGERAQRWREERETLRRSLEDSAWDGAWYLRAFWDDGSPLGSAQNEECRIDSIAQSWAVLSGAADKDRARQAMAAVEEILVRRGDGLVLLFTPPFHGHGAGDGAEGHDPGYIQGYPPGVRENGGQYTHAAIWTAIAFAALGDGDRAAELFSILNPLHHARTLAGVHRYRVEPYVAVADIYSEPPHTGRGGWTWYSGSAGWMYRCAVEWILGFRLRGEALHVDPCIPRSWPGFSISFRYHSSRYEIEIENPKAVMRGVERIELDGESLPGGGAAVPLVDDGASHRVRVVLG